MLYKDRYRYNNVYMSWKFCWEHATVYILRAVIKTFKTMGHRHAVKKRQYYTIMRSVVCYYKKQPRLICVELAVAYACLITNETLFPRYHYSFIIRVNTIWYTGCFKKRSWDLTRLNSTNPICQLAKFQIKQLYIIIFYIYNGCMSKTSKRVQAVTFYSITLPIRTSIHSDLLVWRNISKLFSHVLSPCLLALAGNNAITTLEH